MFYAIAKGASGPCISQDWHYTCEQVSGHPQNKHHKFDSFPEARDWLQKQSCPSFHFHNGQFDDSKATKNRKWYVVKNGRVPGIYDTWEETKIQVDGFPHSNFKSYSSLETAKEMWKSCLIKGREHDIRDGVEIQGSHELVIRISMLKVS